MVRSEGDEIPYSTRYYGPVAFNSVLGSMEACEVEDDNGEVRPEYRDIEEYDYENEPTQRKMGARSLHLVMSGR